MSSKTTFKSDQCKKMKYYVLLKKSFYKKLQGSDYFLAVIKN